MKKYTVIVMPRKDILDPEGKAIRRVARDYLGFDVGEIRVGKYFEIESNASRDVIEKLARNILSNEVVEDYRVIES